MCQLSIARSKLLATLLLKNYFFALLEYNISKIISLEIYSSEHRTCPQVSTEQKLWLPSMTQSSEEFLSSIALRPHKSTLLVSAPGFKVIVGKYCHLFLRCFTPTALEEYIETQFPIHGIHDAAQGSSVLPNLSSGHCLTQGQHHKCPDAELV